MTASEFDRMLEHAPFNYRKIDTNLIAEYPTEKLLKHVASQNWVNNEGGYGYVAEMCKRLEAYDR